jgi:hypothetical protein
MLVFFVKERITMPMEKTAHIHTQAREEKITMTTDPRLAIQFRTRKEAVQAAKSIKWLSKDVTSIEVMGFNLWTICDDHMRFLTKTGYAYARHLQGLDSEWKAPEVSQSDLARAIAS